MSTLYLNWWPHFASVSKCHGHITDLENAFGRQYSLRDRGKKHLQCSEQIKNLTLKELMSWGKMAFWSEFCRIRKTEITRHYNEKVGKIEMNHSHLIIKYKVPLHFFSVNSSLLKMPLPVRGKRFDWSKKTVTYIWLKKWVTTSQVKKIKAKPGFRIGLERLLTNHTI